MMKLAILSILAATAQEKSGFSSLTRQDRKLNEVDSDDIGAYPACFQSCYASSFPNGFPSFEAGNLRSGATIEDCLKTERLLDAAQCCTINQAQPQASDSSIRDDFIRLEGSFYWGWCPAKEIDSCADSMRRVTNQCESYMLKNNTREVFYFEVFPPNEGDNAKYGDIIDENDCFKSALSSEEIESLQSVKEYYDYNCDQRSTLLKGLKICVDDAVDITHIMIALVEYDRSVSCAANPTCPAGCAASYVDTIAKCSLCDNQGYWQRYEGDTAFSVRITDLYEGSTAESCASAIVIPAHRSVAIPSNITIRSENFVMPSITEEAGFYKAHVVDFEEALFYSISGSMPRAQEFYVKVMIDNIGT